MTKNLAREAGITSPSRREVKERSFPIELLKLQDQSPSADHEQAHLQAVLQTLGKKPITRKSIQCTRREWDELIAQEKRQAEELADFIFHNIHEKRDRDINVYLNAINQLVLPLESRPNQHILKATRHIFSHKYSSFINRLGQSADLAEQIIHRTAKEHEELVHETLAGFDVIKLAEEVWEAYINCDARQVQAIERILAKLNDNQAEEFRNHFSSLPARKTAALLHEALYQKDPLGRIAPDGESFNQLLNYRSASEIQEIEFFYNEIYHYDHLGPQESSLRDTINTNFGNKQAAAVLSLLDGWVAEKSAQVIYENLEKYNVVLGDPPADDRSLPAYLNCFYRSLGNNVSESTKELKALPELYRQTQYLSSENFQQLQAALQAQYGFKLSADLYAPNRAFQDRFLAQAFFEAGSLAVKQHLETGYDAKLFKKPESLAIIKPVLNVLNYLHPDQIELINYSFRNQFGLSLADYSAYLAQKIWGESVPEYIETALEQATKGLRHLSLFVDIVNLASYRTLEQQEFEDSQILSAYEKLHGILSTDSGKIPAQEIYQLIAQLSHAQRIQLEALYLKNTLKTLRFQLAQTLKASDFQRTMLLFANIDLAQIAQDFINNPAIILKLPNLGLKTLALLETEISNISGVPAASLLDRLDESAVKAQIRMLLATPAVLHTTELLAQIKVDSKLPLLDLLIPYGNEILTIESAYNFFQVSNILTAPARQTLFKKLARLAFEERLSRQDFARFVLFLEEQDYSVVDQLAYSIAAIKEDSNNVKAFYDLLKQNVEILPLIKMAYNAYSETHSLREEIYEFNLPLFQVNTALLLMDRRDPERAARLFSKAVQSLEGEELAKKISAILVAKSVMPDDTNWIDEMRHQARVYYYQHNQSALITDLLNRGVPAKGKGSALTILSALYGEGARHALEIFKIIKTAEAPNSTKADQIAAIFKDMVPDLAERVFDSFNAYFAQVYSTPKLESLLSRLADNASNSEQIKTIIAAVDKIRASWS